MTGVEFRSKEERQAFFIELIRRGLGVRATCRQCKVSHGTLHNWKKDRDFAELYSAAKAEAEVARMVRDSAVPVALPTFDEKEKNDFLRSYYMTGGVVSDACKDAKVDMMWVLESLDPTHANYDPTFKAEYDRLQPVILQQAEDTIVRSLREQDKNAASNAWKLLELRMPDRYKPAGTRRDDSGEVQVRISAKQAMEMLTNLLKGDEPKAIEAEATVVD